MAAPNLLLANAIYGHTDRAAVATTSTVLLSNPASSGKVFRVTNVTFTNVDTTARTVTLNHHNAASGGGTAQAITSAESVPASGRLTPVTRDAPLYLEEGQSLAALAGTATTIQAIVTYEEIA
jgi:hypothetical protein